MIRSVAIQNLRGIRDGRLEALGTLVILVGPNGSGKSTVLDAALIGASARPFEAAARAIRRHGLPPDRRWLLWQRGESGAAQIQVVTSAGETRTCNLRAPGEKPDRAGEGAGAHREPIFAPLSGVPEVRLVEASDRGFETMWTPLWEEAVTNGRAREVAGCMAPVMPDFIGLEVAEEDGTPLLQFVFTNQWLPVVLAGAGQRKLLRIVLELAACRSRGVVLLEEPEVHQHPAALRQSARAIAAAVARGVQVILSTQSLELLDALLAEMPESLLERMTLYKLILETGQLRASGMPGGDVAVLRKAIEEDLR